MKIRYHKIGTNYWNTTPEFNPEGTPLNHYRFASQDPNGKILIGEEMRTALVIGNFITEMPPVLRPSGHYEWVEGLVPQPNGTYVFQKTYTWIQDVTEDQYQEMLSQWIGFMKGRVITVQEYYLPNIPDGPKMEWQLIDMTKPPMQRYTDIPVTPGVYEGNFWQQPAYDMIPGITEYAGSEAEVILNILEKRTIRL